MAGQRFLNVVSGILTQIASIQASAGAGDAGKIPALNAAGTIDSTMMPAGVGSDSTIVLASATIAASSFVNVFNNAGTPNCKPADNTTPAVCVGFAITGFASAASGTITYAGIVTGLTSIVAGTTYYLGTAGAATATAPTTAGQIVQVLGYGLTTTSLQFEPGVPITLA